jgi:hypothetical protein
MAGETVRMVPIVVARIVAAMTAEMVRLVFDRAGVRTASAEYELVVDAEFNMTPEIDC